MKYLDFEKHIKSELEGAQETVQMDELLSALDLGDTPKKSSKGNFVYWLFIPILLLASLTMAWNLMDESKSNNTHSDALIQPQISGKNSINATEYTNSRTEKKETSLGETLISNSDNLNNLSSGNSSSSSSSSSSSNLSSRSSSNSENNNVNYENSNQEDNSSTLNKNLNSSSKQAQTRDFNREVNSENSKPSTAKEDLSNSYIFLSQDEIDASKSNSTSELIENRNSNVSSPEVLQRDIISMSELNTSSENLIENEMDGNLFSRMRINCPSFNNAEWHMALIPEVGVFSPRKTLGVKSLEAPDSYTPRLAYESSLEGLEIGLYGMLVRDNVPFYIKGGVSYSRISERMDLEYEFTQQDTTIGIISTTISGNGDTITHIYGDIITETTYKGSNRQHHYIHLFDFPVSLGYSTYLGGFDIGIEAGVRINFMTRATGNLLTTKKDYTPLSLNKLFKNRIGVNYFGGLMIGRNFGSLGDFYLAPRFTYFPDDFSNAANTVSQKYFAIGINAGVVYKIN
ncbi:MAG: hypothetical protein P1U56_04570 [Saprospiraceae bacterium]|nr:hypothetical protein [Saprospiraceae bacterium]